MHIANVVFGSPVRSSLMQAVRAFAFGTAFYILRRGTGLLIWPLLLHESWDMSLLRWAMLQPAPLLVPLWLHRSRFLRSRRCTGSFGA
ncbi:hypothetical protein [Leucobacter chromiireducens]|uniref:hypothetical protein n=1 Tax=Leucobacter chromiireducens TaxID=283877 RepID=UPI003F7D2AF3